ncbi:MAG: hypothetical protein ACTTJX_10485, partial [Fusobacterium sp.]
IGILGTIIGSGMEGGGIAAAPATGGVSLEVTAGGVVVETYSAGVGATKGVMKYEKNGKYIEIAPNGDIISFGTIK